ncbi:hypothetical protein [Thioflexithrix psekupsensis]|uniref:Uncharacterized protein n=1 Tax=Thioflexithrix psekupsensis TaxID=1570016 RepID=A0A251XB71_9GAMM|nr:hypothetical protein [Thioflexithrix psekupsensis]OUD15584.1 hypothetical protein TPSD3_03435 [Thioflexithrix psekupsensis]
MTFIELCLDGDVLEDEIDDFVDNWHEDETINCELHEYLGMTWEEYSVWATRPSILPFILSARKRNTTFDIELNQERLALAARTETVEEAKRLESWLKQIGKIQ